MQNLEPYVSSEGRFHGNFDWLYCSKKKHKPKRQPPDIESKVYESYDSLYIYPNKESGILLDYNTLLNRPSINQEILQGNIQIEAIPLEFLQLLLSEEDDDD